MNYTIDRADFDDTEDICAVQIASIERLDGAHYSKEAINAWLEGVGITQTAHLLEDSESEIFVARNDSEMVMGFCALKGNEVTAIFVDPACVNQGLGTRLLREAEKYAKRKGRSSIRLLSTLNSVPFYDKCGYDALRKSVFTINDDTALDVLEMRKRLKQ